MAISQTRYILITSGVGGQAVAGRRELIARYITTNVLAPTKGIIEFGGGAAAALKNVGLHFGTASNEYKFAAKYFSFVSKDARQPAKISFARYTPAATKAEIISTITVATLAQLKAIDNGSMTISLGGTSYELTGLDFSAISSYADAATVIQTAIQANTAGGAIYTAATVTYNDAFILNGGTAGACAVGYATEAASGTNIAGLIGWDIASNPVLSDGCDAETLTAALDRINNTSNNAGSITFDGDLTAEQIKEVATWTNNQNVVYLYSQKVTASNAATVHNEVDGLDGVCLNLGTTGDFAAYMPMSIFACINYERVNAATNFMFNMFDNDTPTVTDDTNADVYDALKVNYLGATQQAGKKIAFYQRGVLQGDISDIGVYCNEIWLKDALLTEFLNLLLALKQLPANSAGADTARGVMLPIIEEAKNNGVIQPGKTLTSVQKAYITSITGDDDAWRDVELNGWWLDVTVKSEVSSLNGLVEYSIDYLLVYAKGDSIKKVVGQNIMI